MKRTALAALLALASAAAARADASLLLASAGSSIGAEASAQLAHTPAAGLGVFVSRWDSQDYGTLSGYGLRFGWNIYGPLGLEARTSYLESKDERVDTTLIPLEAALIWRFHLGQYLAPYVGGGIGYYMKDVELNDAESESLSENAAGYFALAGIQLHLGAFSLFAEGKYNLVGTDEDLHWRGADVDAQNSLDGFSTSFGIKLGF
jgi:opacity protein-like surface antigen